MICNGIDSKELVKATCEQMDIFDERGGFDHDEDYMQFSRDVRDVARKLYIAEQVIYANSLLSIYETALKNGEIGDAD